MKIRYIIGIFTIVISCIILGSYFEYKRQKTVSIDMVFYNKQLNLISEGLEKGVDRSTLESIYQCDILLMSDENYESTLNELFKEGYVVLDLYKSGQYIGKTAWNMGLNTYQQLKLQLFEKFALACSILLVLGYFGLLVVYYRYVLPFRKLQDFSKEIAKGNLDIPLRMEKHNFFGAFTESFDMMRDELHKAKENEYRANRSKKELVAELSHDIKTPLSTIKATCEVMQVKEKSQDILEKIGVISGKAEMIDKLVSNMFHATLEDLEVLKVEVTEVSSLCITSMFQELKFNGEIQIENEIPECLVNIDKLRLQQVIDNIINNSYKYAGTVISVSFQERMNGIEIRIQDRGEGVPEEELAMITEKFYRGSNTKGKIGYGLGLYLANMFMKRMHGGMECHNANGFLVILFVKKVS
jgi:signal transduction histidine kinase